jgi:hypothetical protein
VRSRKRAPSLTLQILSPPPHQSKYQTDQEDNDENGEKDFGDSSCARRQSAEAEYGQDDSDNKEYQSPPQHGCSSSIQHSF